MIQNVTIQINPKLHLCINSMFMIILHQTEFKNYI